MQAAEMSPNRGRQLTLVATCLVALALASCGQKGPLYLPDQKPSDVKKKSSPESVLEKPKEQKHDEVQTAPPPS